MEYKNLWYNKRNKNSKETFNNKPIKTIGEFTICKHSDIEYHIVYNSFCVGMNAGINGAIDRIINRSLEKSI